MKRSQLLLSLAGILLIILIYQLPQVVVENEKLQEISNEQSIVQGHMSIPDEITSRTASIKDSIDISSNIQKKTNFALSLAKIYLDYGVLDSAVYYGDKILRWTNDRLDRIADIYYKAYERSPDPKLGRIYAEKANKIYNQLLEKDPTNLFLKNRLAMTLVPTDNPMSGIMMLREITEEDPNNRTAILNLGLLAIQSGQYGKARDRFDKLTTLKPDDHEAKLYLAVTLMEIDNQDQAKLILSEILATTDSIPAIKAMAGEYLKSLQIN